MTKNIMLDYDKSNHLRALHPHAEPKFESGEYLLKVLKVKNLRTIQEYYGSLAEDQYASFDEIALDGYDLTGYMTQRESNFYNTLTRTIQTENQKFFAICELKDVYLWNFNFYKSRSFKAITFKITDDAHESIEGLFIYSRKNCKENLYSYAQLEEILSSNANSKFNITFQASPTTTQTDSETIIRPRLLRVYEFELR